MSEWDDDEDGQEDGAPSDFDFANITVEELDAGLAEELAEEWGLDESDIYEMHSGETDIDFGDFGSMTREELDGLAEYLAEAWDLDVGDVYDMYYGYND